MKKIATHAKSRMSLIKTGKVILLISGLILLGFNSCRPTKEVKYGPPPNHYKQMEKNQ
ncbi:MAG TPA: hypothetical protein PKN48_14985 [Bacteroidales bacterium]|nr:hypothetical protein [Bacteroidales bacterium]